MSVVKLENRTVIRLSGKDRIDFLNGITTNVVQNASDTSAVYAGLLTPQGKYLFDMIIFADNEALYLDIETAFKDQLIQRLTMYRMRADVAIDDLSAEYHVYAATTEPASATFATKDPRHTDLGWRIISKTAPAGDAWDIKDYEQTRIRAGVPDGSRDIAREKYFWPETNAEALNGTSYTKGCYVGQELVSRLKHRTEVKRLIIPATITGGAPAHGTDIKTDAGRAVGTVLTSQDEDALIYLRLEHKDAVLSADDRPVLPKT